jgi:Ca2+-binding EF-hand superfamily protein
MINKLFKVMVLGAILTTTGAFAQEEPQQVQQRPNGGQRDPQEAFDKLDADKDGKLSLAEVEKAQRGKLKENFSIIDANKDNFLDKEELIAYRKTQKAKKVNQN